MSMAFSFSVPVMTGRETVFPPIVMVAVSVAVAGIVFVAYIGFVPSV